MLGEQIRNLVLHRDKNMQVGSRAELFLFLGSRAQHVEEVIEPAINENKIVLCDRFHDSSVAYQGYARGLGMENVDALSAFATNGLIPNLTFFLDLDPNLGLLRAAKQRKADLMEDETIEFHSLVRKAFVEIAKNDPERVKFIDAAQDPKNVLDEVLKYLQ